MARFPIFATLLLAAARHVLADLSFNPASTAPVANSQSDAVLSWAAGSVQPSYANLSRLGPGRSPSAVNMSVLLPYTLTSSPTAINSTVIAFISCDAKSYSNQFTPADLYSFAVAGNVQAVIMYSTVNSACAIQGALPDGFDQVYTTISLIDSTRILADDATSLPAIFATIGMQPQTFDYNAYLNLTATPPESKNTFTGLNTKAAMIILYVVTAVVAVLFMSIIVSGAIRLHRHPERYHAPLSDGNATRARGLARAMLDSLPIIKYNQPAPAKEMDVELAPTTPNPDQTRTSTDSPGKDTVDEKTFASTEKARSPPRDAADIPTPHIGSHAITQNDDNTAASSTCSICTDDFEPGQDVRVLPCDHKFHPECVDPWLLNVSGTCPLCRIDLNPDSTRPSTSGENADDLPPPLDVGSPDPAASRPGLRRSLFGPSIFASNTSAAESNAPMTGHRDEVLAVLRRWRRQQVQQQERGRAASTADAHAHDVEGTARSQDEAFEERRRRRLSAMFNVRTRRAS